MHTIKARLQQRGRENAAEVGLRMMRAESLKLPAGPDALTIVNDGTLEAAGERLRELIINVGQSTTA